MRPEKTLLLQEIEERVSASTALFVTRYEKLPPDPAWELRSALAAVGSSLEVVKKSLLIKALGGSFDETLLSGHIGVVFVEQPDAMEPAKALFKFSQANEGLLEVLCGRIEGTVLPGSDIEALSKLPALPEMRAQFLATLVAPMSLLLGTLEAVLAAPLSILEQKQNKVGES